MGVPDGRTPQSTLGLRAAFAARIWRLRPFSKSIASKIFVALGTVLVVSIAVTFVFETRLTRAELARQSRAALDDDVRALQTVFEAEQAELLARLREASSSLVTPDSTDTPSLASGLASVRDALNVDAVAVFDDDGAVIASAGIPLAPLGREAVAGTTTAVPRALLLSTPGHSYVQAAVIPLRAEGRTFLLAGGTLFDDAVAQRMQQIVGDAVVLAADGAVVGTSAAGVTSVQPPRGDDASPSIVRLGGQALLIDYVEVVPARGSWGPQGVAGVATAHPFAALDATLTRNRLLGAGLLALLVLVLGWLLFMRLARPLFQLADTARRVGRGEVATPFVTDSDDEIGELGRTLEAMRSGLEAQLAVIESQTKDLQDSARRIVGAQDAERRRLAHDLHDGLQRRLVMLRIRVGTLAADPLADPSQANAAVGEVAREVDEVIDEVRAVSHAIYPSILQDRGLQGAVRSLGRRCPVPIAATFSPDPLPRLPLAVEGNAYLLLSEAVTNAMKHAAASRIEVHLGVDPGTLTVVVVDDGVGVDPGHLVHNGLLHMRDRVAAAGGTLDVDGRPGRGTRVTAVIPAETDLEKVKLL